MNPLIAATVVGALLIPAPPVDLLGGTPRMVRAPTTSEPDRPRALWPLDPQPEVVEGFLAPSSTWSAGHRGVDLLGTAGAPVRAALAGEVVFAGTVAGRGVVVLAHGRYRTTYEPVRARLRVGDRVSAGTAIGELQSAMSHCPPRSCLHWGLVEGDHYLDPLGLVGSGRVRLLPNLEDQARGWARW